MTKNLQKIIIGLCAVLVVGVACFYFISASKMTVAINDVSMKVDKDLILSNDKENHKRIYVDMVKMLELQKIPYLINEYGITALISGSKVVRLNAEKNMAVINGEMLDLTGEDFIYKKDRLYISRELYKKLFDQAMFYKPNEKVKLAVYDVGSFRIPEDLTFGEYFAMSQEEREKLFVKNPHTKKILESEATILPGDELNPIIEEAYNEVSSSFDLYHQYQLYNWHLILDESQGTSGYMLCSNAQTILWQFENMKILNEVANIKEFTAKDIEYINRINTLYNAIDFSKVKLLGHAIASYMNRLDPSISGWEVYKEAAEKALEQFNRCFAVEKIDRLPIPDWAEFDSYYARLKYAPYVKYEKSLLDAIQQLLDTIPQDIQETIDWIKNYQEIKDIILAVYPEWKDYFLDEGFEKALEEFVQNLKNSSFKPLTKMEDYVKKSKLATEKMVKLYDNLNLLKDAVNLLSTEKHNDLFAELNNSKVESASNILNTMINPGGMIQAGVQLGNINLISTGGILTLELFVAQEFMSRIEKLGKLVSGMILMSWDTDSIDDVYRGRITLNEYLDGE